MRRAAIVFAVIIGAACGDDSQRVISDAPVIVHDGPETGSGSGSGSGSADFAMNVETSPRDHGLEVMTGALGLAIILGPIGLRRRRAS